MWRELPPSRATAPPHCPQLEHARHGVAFPHSVTAASSDRRRRELAKACGVRRGPGLELAFAEGRRNRLRRIQRFCTAYAVEVPLIGLLIFILASLPGLTLEALEGGDVLQAFIAQLVEQENYVATTTLSFLLLGLFAMAVSTMSALFSAILCSSPLPTSCRCAGPSRPASPAGAGGQPGRPGSPRSRSGW